MLAQGTFYGVREGADLVAIAGTHLFSDALGICTIGNVYTRRDHRRRGLGARVTSAVVEHALERAVPTIVLNVGQSNEGARRVYRIDPAGLGAIRAWLDRFWAAALADFRDEVEADREKSE